jgi:hypothetical protein
VSKERETGIHYPRALDTKKIGFSPKKTFFETKTIGFVTKTIYFGKKRMKTETGTVFPVIETIVSTI